MVRCGGWVCPPPDSDQSDQSLLRAGPDSRAIGAASAASGGKSGKHQRPATPFTTIASHGEVHRPEGLLKERGASRRAVASSRFPRIRCGRRQPISGWPRQLRCLGCRATRGNKRSGTAPCISPPPRAHQTGPPNLLPLGPKASRPRQTSCPGHPGLFPLPASWLRREA